MLPKPKVNILLVDNQPKNLLILAAMLENLGQKLVKATSGEEALRCLLHQEFALILLNVEMPVMDGFETARLIRERPTTAQHTPIIFFTDSVLCQENPKTLCLEEALLKHKSDTEALKAYSLGAVDYWCKPIVPEVLLAKVSALISVFQKTQEIKQQAAQREARYRKIQTNLQRANQRLKAEVKERRQAEEALRASEIRYKAIVENSYEIITLTDEQDNIYYQNSAQERILGYSLEESSGKRPVDKVHPNDVSKVQAAMSAILAQPRIPITVEYRMQRADGSWVWLESVGANWLAHPDIQAIVANTRDISEHKDAQVVLQQRVERERLITKSIQRIRESLDLDAILHMSVEEVRQFLQVDRVLVYRVWSDGTGSTIAEAVVPECPKILGVTFPAEVFPQDIHPLYSQGRVRAVVNPEIDDVAPCLIEFLQQWGVKSKLVVPIVCQGKLWGLLIAHQCSQNRQWQPLEIDLLQQFGVQLAIAIQQADLYHQVQQELAERKQAQAALRQARDQLEIRVAERTAELTQINQSLQTEICDRIAAEEALRTSEERFRVTLKNSPTTVFHQDTDLRYTWLYNPIPGFSTEQYIGKKDSELFATEDAQRLTAITQRVLTTGVGTREEVFMTIKGDVRYYDLTVEPLSGSFGEITGITGAAMDITQSKQIEEIRRALTAEKELRRLQLRFFSMVSHEFRTPLSTILGSAQLLKSCTQTWTEEKKLRNLNRIETAAKNLTQMLDELLTINRAESGKLEYNPIPIDLKIFCYRIVEELQLQANLKHQIMFNFEGKCPIVNLDENLMRSILINLLSNAQKYSPQGGNINLTLTCNQKAAIFKIQDQGIGITLEDKTHLFELFHRGNNVGKIPGTGLGLSVVKKCLELQRGEISITSEMGVGTTVTVTIPLTPSRRFSASR